MKTHKTIIILIVIFLAACSNNNKKQKEELETLKKQYKDQLKTYEAGGQPGNVFLSESMRPENLSSKIKVTINMLTGKNPEGEFAQLKKTVIYSKKPEAKALMNYDQFIEWNKQVKAQNRVIKYNYINCSDSQLLEIKNNLAPFEINETVFTEVEILELNRKINTHLYYRHEIFSTDNLILCGHLNELESQHIQVTIQSHKVILYNTQINFSEHGLSSLKISAYELLLLGSNSIKNTPLKFNRNKDIPPQNPGSIHFQIIKLFGSGSLDISLEGYSQTRD